jgi:putative flippase GtrA
VLPPRWRTPLAQLSRYGIVSGLAMALDWTIFLTLVGAAARPAAAGVLGYVVGLGLHYVLCLRFVFEAAATQKGSARLCMEFALSGLAGVAVTGSSIAIATQLLGLGAVAGKLCAISASFAVVYSLRRGVVFASRACSVTVGGKGVRAN